jgi:2,3-bisphosphoglycerate-independent phosphoglycerate mutase
MARDKNSIPSWATVLKEEPNTEDPLLGWLKGVGKHISRDLVADILRDVGAEAAGQGAAYLATRNAAPDKKEAAKDVEKYVNKAVQAVFKRSVNELRRKRDEAKAKAMIKEELRRDQQFKKLMQDLRVPGY